MLDDRKKKVLQAIVEEYINTAEPVSSNALTNNYGLNYSSATIRNEMADLEKKVNSYALASFICSLVGLLVCGLPLGIAAVITGGYALNSYKEEKENGKWMAVTGLALGIIDIVCVIIYLSTAYNG